jgi:hypothetical protein
MWALIRYQAALMIRAHRWVGPLLLYATLLTFVGNSQPLSQGLDWSAAMLVPASAWLTRSMLTAEPPAARACAAVAGGPHRAHLAALATGLAGGVILMAAGAGYELARCQRPADGRTLATVIAVGLVTAAVCLLVGSAVGTLCNPPVIRHPAVALLGTTGAVVVALAASISPANAAIRGSDPAALASGWLTGLPLLVALALAGLSWLISTLPAVGDGGDPPGRVVGCQETGRAEIA